MIFPTLQKAYPEHYPWITRKQLRDFLEKFDTDPNNRRLQNLQGRAPLTEQQTAGLREIAILRPLEDKFIDDSPEHINHLLMLSQPEPSDAEYIKWYAAHLRDLFQYEADPLTILQDYNIYTPLEFASYIVFLLGLEISAEEILRRGFLHQYFYANQDNIDRIREGYQLLQLVTKEIPAVKDIFLQTQYKGIRICEAGARPRFYALNGTSSFYPLPEVIIQKSPFACTLSVANLRNLSYTFGSLFFIEVLKFAEKSDAKCLQDLLNSPDFLVTMYSNLLSEPLPAENKCAVLEILRKFCTVEQIRAIASIPSWFLFCFQPELVETFTPAQITEWLRQPLTSEDWIYAIYLSPFERFAPYRHTIHAAILLLLENQPELILSLSFDFLEKLRSYPEIPEACRTMLDKMTQELHESIDQHTAPLTQQSYLAIHQVFLKYQAHLSLIKCLDSQPNDYPIDSCALQVLILETLLEVSSMISIRNCLEIFEPNLPRSEQVQVLLQWATRSQNALLHERIFARLNEIDPEKDWQKAMLEHPIPLSPADEDVVEEQQTAENDVPVVIKRPKVEGDTFLHEAAFHGLGALSSALSALYPNLEEHPASCKEALAVNNHAGEDVLDAAIQGNDPLAVKFIIEFHSALESNYLFLTCSIGHAIADMPLLHRVAIHNPSLLPLLWNMLSIPQQEKLLFQPDPNGLILLHQVALHGDPKILVYILHGLYQDNPHQRDDLLKAITPQGDNVLHLLAKAHPQGLNLILEIFYSPSQRLPACLVENHAHLTPLELIDDISFLLLANNFFTGHTLAQIRQFFTKLPPSVRSLHLADNAWQTRKPLELQAVIRAIPPHVSKIALDETGYYPRTKLMHCPTVLLAQARFAEHMKKIKAMATTLQIQATTKPEFKNAAEKASGFLTTLGQLENQFLNGHIKKEPFLSQVKAAILDLTTVVEPLPHWKKTLSMFLNHLLFIFSALAKCITGRYGIFHAQNAEMAPLVSFEKDLTKMTKPFPIHASK